ncbi:MAG: nitronate monooxygenase [Desulfomonile tiedjei]|uniref:Nitronate monooxygenase n=1 Tax=Desulfomonile tiedjei TaxID=2358 RepID=A0A9D6Z530_9BACT|nr:nitronate monooxygenase [Desulfomonile tiedjei]
MAKIETAFTEMFGVDYPIIGAPMFLVSYEELTVAVSEAGGLGAFPLPNYRTADDLRAALKNIRNRTDKPIGVNIHLSGKFPWKEQLALCLDAGVKFFLTSLGDPRLIIDDVHASGGRVFADIISLEQALKARDRGVDGLIAVASDAGGHCGRVPTLILVPYFKSHVGLPVVAAGGISTGAQMAAAIAVGACAVVVGTRLIATDESKAVQAYKDAVVAAGPDDIVCTDKITDNPASWLAHSIKDFQKRPELGSKRWLDLWSAGKSVAQTEEIKPAGAVISEMVEDYRRTCEELAQTISAGRHSQSQ